jgi:two-component system NtrC family sensor kinase
MKIGRVFPDLLTALGTAASVEDGLRQMLRRLVRLTGATAGVLVFRPPRGPHIVVTAGPRALPPQLDAWLRAAVRVPARGVRRMRARLPHEVAVGPQRRRSRREAANPALLRTPLAAPGRAFGELALLGNARRLTGTALPAGFPRELGGAIEHVWRLHQRTLRLRVLNEITRLGVSSEPLDQVFTAFVEGVAHLVTFDGIGVALIDTARGEAELIDVLARAVPSAPPSDRRVRMEDTLLARVAATASAVNVADVAAADVPEASRIAFSASGYRSVLLVPLVSRGTVFGAVIVAARVPAAFDVRDVEIMGELADPLAAAVEQRRLLAESRRRAEELTALYATSQLITSRLEVAAVLDRISRAVTALIGATGCGIGLLSADGTQVEHGAAHGFKSDAWRALAIPVGEGIIGRCAELGAPVLIDDIRNDPRSVRREVDEQEGIRSMLCVPLRVRGTTIGVLSAFATRPAAFTADSQRILELFAEQAGIAIHNAQLFEQSVRHARETRALFEAGRAVTASLDLNETMRVIMEQAKSVLDVESCGIMTLDRDTRELVSVASLDLPVELVGTIRVKEGEGITGMAVRERRPVQSADAYVDHRVRYPGLPRQSGFRSMLASPLVVGDRAIGAIIVLRHDVHRFAPDEEELLRAFADQAAIAMEHARLYTELEGMVAERTRELDAQKRFVEVVLETLPLGVFVLDATLATVRANRDGARVLACAPVAGEPFTRLLPTEKAETVRLFLRRALERGEVAATEEEIVIAAEAKILLLTVAPLVSASGPSHLVLIVEDVTRAKRLERQMLLTERLTTAGRMAAGVAHELNNPLATIAGCAESLLGRLRDPEAAPMPERDDFAHYLGLIEEEAYRCKDITGSLLHFVREPGSRRTLTDVNAIVQKAVELLTHQSRFSESRFATELDPSLPLLSLNEGQMRQVFLGLASNALEAMDGRGTLTLRSRVVSDEVEVELEDEGPGIADEILPKIFDPFFTTKPPGQGTGLGLAIAQGIVADHGGRLEVTSRSGKGSIFRVVLPV